MPKTTFKHHFIAVLLACLAFTNLTAQLANIRRLVDTLASPCMQGRGYTSGGLGRAASFIENEYKVLGITKIGDTYRQSFTHDIIVFEGATKFSLNGKSLRAGKDFIATPGSLGVKLGNKLEPLDSIRWIDPSNRVVVEKLDKLNWSVSTIQDDYTVFQVLKGSFPDVPISYKAHLDARRVKSFVSDNMIGIVKGTEIPDSFLVVTAHYDHLGTFGKDAIFRGANDNASGVALMLDLAAKIAVNPLRYSVVFIAFAGEEAGLLGSAHFVKNPLVELSKIRFLVNLDLLGTGDDGIMVVNATEFPEEWKLLDSINSKNSWLKQVGQRGKARNSDHYFFTEAGVPAFFIYTMGGITAYHDIYDLPETLPLTKTEEVGKLILAYFERLAGNE